MDRKPGPRRALIVASLFVLIVANARAAVARRGAQGSVVLDGIPLEVWWNDGDSFTPKRGMRERPARIVGYNTLETHGPVHQWGGWTGPELLALTVRATQVASAKVRHCISYGRPDRYGRPLVRCPDVARELVGDGLAMVFAVNEAPDRELVALQSAAQAKGRGIWARGVPATIVTSIHSVDEDARRAGAGRNGQASGAYNRVVDTRTGETSLRRHGERFQICQVVCEGAGKDKSCLTYVPFGRQRRDRPRCL